MNNFTQSLLAAQIALVGAYAAAQDDELTRLISLRSSGRW